MSFISNLFYGDNTERLSSLKETIAKGKPEALSHTLALGDRLIQTSTEGPSTCESSLISEFTQLITDHPELSEQVSCKQTYKKHTLEDLLLHTGKLSTDSNEHETALKIYAQGLSLKHIKGCKHPYKFQEASTLSLIALGRHIEATSKMNPTDFQKFYGNNLERLNALLEEYEQNGKYQEAIEVLYKVPNTPLLFLKKLFLYTSINPLNTFLSQLLSCTLEKTPSLIRSQLMEEAIQQQDFVSACNLHKLLSPTSANAALLTLNYAQKAFEADLDEQAHLLFRQGCSQSLQENNITQLYPYLDSLLLCSESRSDLKTGLSIVYEIIKHPKHDIKTLIPLIISSPTLNSSIQPHFALIQEELKKHPTLAISYYEHLFSEQGEEPLSPEDLTNWFIPLLECYKAQKNKDKAVAFIRSELVKTEQPSSVKASLKKLLTQYDLTEAIDYFSTFRTEKRASANTTDLPLSLNDIQEWLIPLIQCHQKQNDSKKAIALLQQELELLYKQGGEDSLILILCNTLLELSPKDSNALFCHGIAKHRLALMGGSVYNEFGIVKRSLNQKDLISILEDLKQAYVYASGNLKTLYLICMQPFLTEFASFNPLNEIELDLLKKAQATYFIYNMYDSRSLLENVSQEEIPISQTTDEMLQMHNLQEKESKVLMKQLYKQVEDQSKNWDTYAPLHAVYQRMIPYIYGNSGLTPSILGNYPIVKTEKSLSRQEIQLPDIIMEPLEGEFYDSSITHVEGATIEATQQVALTTSIELNIFPNEESDDEFEDAQSSFSSENLSN